MPVRMPYNLVKKKSKHFMANRVNSGGEVRFVAEYERFRRDFDFRVTMGYVKSNKSPEGSILL